MSGLGLIGLLLPVPRPTFAQTPDVSAEPSKRFVDNVLADPELKKRLGVWYLNPQPSFTLVLDSRLCYRVGVVCQVTG